MCSGLVAVRKEGGRSGRPRNGHAHGGVVRRGVELRGAHCLGRGAAAAAGRTSNGDGWLRQRVDGGMPVLHAGPRDARSGGPLCEGRAGAATRRTRPLRRARPDASSSGAHTPCALAEAARGIPPIARCGRRPPRVCVACSAAPRCPTRVLAMRSGGATRERTRHAYDSGFRAQDQLWHPARAALRESAGALRPGGGTSGQVYSRIDDVNQRASLDGLDSRIAWAKDVSCARTGGGGAHAGGCGACEGVRRRLPRGNLAAARAGASGQSDRLERLPS